jgi:glycerate-2-kinase
MLWLRTRVDIDGVEDNAGAYVDPDTVAAALARGLKLGDQRPQRRLTATGAIGRPGHQRTTNTNERLWRCWCCGRVRPVTPKKNSWIQ